MSEHPDHNHFKEIIERYVHDQCSEEEKAIVESWFLQEMSQNKGPEINEGLEKEAWDKITQQRGINRSRRPVLKLLMLAAATAAMFIFGFFLFFQSQQEDKTPVSAKNSRPVEAIQAPGDENILKLLPDSSLIILSKNSKLILNDKFNENGRREVTLIGKAFFDIKHDPSRPFIIHSGKVTTEVLGTSFDISSSENSGQVVVNVIRGKVRVRESARQLGVLTKDMQIVYLGEQKPAVIKQVDASKELAWNKDDLEFNDVSFKEAKTLLEERFGVKIHIPDPELQQTRFTTSLGQSETLEHFLKIVCEFNNADYTYNQNTKQIIIKPLNP